MLRTLRKKWHQMRYLLKWPPIGAIDFGDLGMLKPIDESMSYGRGSQSIARYYIDNFISQNSNYISGHVLEIADSSYTKRFGGNKVIKSDVLHAVTGNPNATIVADLTQPNTIRSETFDCIIFTQTLQFIYDFKQALYELNRILKPSGTILLTSSGISQSSRYDVDRWGEYWRFTSSSMKRLLSEAFPHAQSTITTCGNVLAAISLLEGLTSKDLKKDELDFIDPNYEIIICSMVNKVKLT